MRIRRHPIQKARIELIPMIDTMAFLLVFFMIASLAMTQQLGMSVSLPRAMSAAEQPTSDRTLVVTVDRRGRLFLNKERVRWGQLESAVRARVKARPELAVVLNADEALRHGAVVRVLDALNRAGAKRLSIAMVRPDYERAGTHGTAER